MKIKDSRRENNLWQNKTRTLDQPKSRKHPHLGSTPKAKQRLLYICVLGVHSGPGKTTLSEYFVCVLGVVSGNEKQR